MGDGRQGWNAVYTVRPANHPQGKTSFAYGMRITIVHSILSITDAKGRTERIFGQSCSFGCTYVRFRSFSSTSLCSWSWCNRTATCCLFSLVVSILGRGSSVPYPLSNTRGRVISSLDWSTPVLNSSSITISILIQIRLRSGWDCRWSYHRKIDHEIRCLLNLHSGCWGGLM